MSCNYPRNSFGRSLISRIVVFLSKIIDVGQNKVLMRRNYTLIIAFTSIAALGAILYFSRKSVVIKKRTIEVADEGYETAYDILFPIEKPRRRRSTINKSIINQKDNTQKYI